MYVCLCICQYLLHKMTKPVYGRFWYVLQNPVYHDSIKRSALFQKRISSSSHAHNNIPMITSKVQLYICFVSDTIFKGGVK